MRARERQGAIETERDDYVPLDDAILWMPGETPSVSTVYRWAMRGAKGRDGIRVRLRAVRLGRRYYTTRAWFDAFRDQLAQVPPTEIAEQAAFSIGARSEAADHTATIGSGPAPPSDTLARTDVSCMREAQRCISERRARE